ncbi:hypothetical protein BH11MYX3_BH11MYX3_30020 [soil metagenome]
MLIALTVICAAATVALIIAEYAHLTTVRVLAKSVASSSFVAIGVEAFHIGHDPGRVHYGQVIFIGLVFGAIGDLALLGKSSRAFLAGLGAFLIGHLAYVVAVTYLVSVGSWISGAGVLAAVPVVAGGIALALLWPRLGSMRGPVIAYVLAIVTMVIAAIAVWRTDSLPEPQRTRLVLGASLFFISDLAVARDKFVAQSWVNKLWGLPAYFAGQLLIAWSLIGL